MAKWFAYSAISRFELSALRHTIESMIANIKMAQRSDAGVDGATVNQLLRPQNARFRFEHFSNRQMQSSNQAIDERHTLVQRFTGSEVPLFRYHAPVIIDTHTHIFPPEVRDTRDAFLSRDATFREMYSRPSARIATAEGLLASMDAAGVERSVACGFAWSDAELVRRHNEYLLEAARQSGGRIIPFCTVLPSDGDARDDIKRWVARGARGLGELRPQSQGYGLIDSEEADLLAWAADAYDLALLFHASEPIGHPYPGKGGMPVDQLGRFIADFPGVTVIAAHWGGGLPFYALMPEVHETFARTYFDSAGTKYLYAPAIYACALALVGADHVLFGSDFPLVDQEEALRELRDAHIDDEARALVEGENAQRLLRL